LAISYIYSTLPELTLAWFVVISGILQLVIMIVWSAKKNIKIRLIIPSYSLEVKKLFSLLLPNILAGGILQ